LKSLRRFTQSIKKATNKPSGKRVKMDCRNTFKERTFGPSATAKRQRQENLSPKAEQRVVSEEKRKWGS